MTAFEGRGEPMQVQIWGYLLTSFPVYQLLTSFAVSQHITSFPIYQLGSLPAPYQLNTLPTLYQLSSLPILYQFCSSPALHQLDSLPALYQLSSLLPEHSTTSTVQGQTGLHWDRLETWCEHCHEQYTKTCYPMTKQNRQWIWINHCQVGDSAWKSLYEAAL